MSETAGFIAIHRKIVNWEWYKDANVKSLFLHCLLKANYEKKRWQGIEIKRGSFVTSLPNLSAETGLSVRSVRTAISKLEGSGDIISTITNRYRIITIVNYDIYQCLSVGHGQIDSQTTGKRAVKRQSKRQSNASQPDSQTTTTNNNNNITSEGVRPTGAQPSPQQHNNGASPAPAEGGAVCAQKERRIPLFFNEWYSYCETLGKTEEQIFDEWAALDSGHDLPQSEITRIKELVNGRRS